ncbi:MAG: MFS transporter [Firmicutes bacterium]|nr:MFS transporter [Bacillota bacterium]
MTQIKKKELGMGSVIGYGIGAVGEGIGYNVFFSFFIFFLTTVAGIPPAIAGVISSVAVLWDAVTDPLIGNWSDTTRNPKGRRRPFIMVGSILFGLSIALVFINIDMPTGVKVVYFIVVNAFYWVALTSCVIPHISLGSELTDDFDGRTKLRSCAVTLMGIGTLLANSATLLLVEFYTGLFGSDSAGWAATGVTFGIIIALVYNLCCVIVKGFEPENPNIRQAVEKKSKANTVSTFFKNAKKSFKNKSLVILLVVDFAYNVFVTLGAGLFVYVLSHVYAYDAAQTSTVYLVQGILVIVAAILAGVVARFTDKKIVMASGMLISIIACLLVGLMPVSGVVMYIYVVLYALGNSAFWTMIYAMSYDCAIVEQIDSGDKPDGLYTSLIGLFMKFGNSLGTLIVGFGLQLVGFSADLQVQTEATLHGIKILFGVAPSVVLAIGFIAAIAYPLTKKKYSELLEVLHDKEENR